MKFDLEPFLCIGITLAVLKIVGKMPVVKERLNKSASCLEMLFLSRYITVLWILYGPADWLISREERINLISSLLVSKWKNKSGFSFVR